MLLPIRAPSQAPWRWCLPQCLSHPLAKQLIVPFLFAGCGMACAGAYLDLVQVNDGVLYFEYRAVRNHVRKI